MMIFVISPIDLSMRVCVCVCVWGNLLAITINDMLATVCGNSCVKYDGRSVASGLPGRTRLHVSPSP